MGTDLRCGGRGNSSVETRNSIYTFRLGGVVHKDGPKRYIAGRKTAAGLSTVIFGGGLFFEESISALVLENLPSVIVLKRADVSVSLKNLMAILQHESQTSAFGSRVVIEALIQLIFIETLRTLDFKTLKIGFLKGLSHPEISGVIHAMHQDFRRDWTVVELAKIYGSSRSSFAANFKATVGLSPMEYLQRWRMVH